MLLLFWPTAQYFKTRSGLIFKILETSKCCKLPYPHSECYNNDDIWFLGMTDPFFGGGRDGRFIGATGRRGLLRMCRGIAALPGQVVVVCFGSMS